MFQRLFLLTIRNDVKVRPVTGTKYRKPFLTLQSTVGLLHVPVYVPPKKQLSVSIIKYQTSTYTTSLFVILFNRCDYMPEVTPTPEEKIWWVSAS